MPTEPLGSRGTERAQAEKAAVSAPTMEKIQVCWKGINKVLVEINSEHQLRNETQTENAEKCCTKATVKTNPYKSMQVGFNSDKKFQKSRMAEDCARPSFHTRLRHLSGTLIAVQSLMASRNEPRAVMLSEMLLNKLPISSC